jgi:phage-related protein
MVSPTKQSGEAMKQLGIEVTNSDGSMKSMKEIMDMLRGKFGKLTEAEQAHYASMIAGKNAMSGMLAIVNASNEDYEKLTAAIDNCDGAAEKMAATMQDNLQGDITIFKSALEGAQIALSDKLTPSLREFVQFGTGAVADLTKAFEEDGLNGAMEALGNIISDGIALIIDGLPQFVDAGIKLLGAIIQGIMDNFPALVEAAGQIAETIISNIMSYVEEKNPQLAKVLNKIGGAVKKVYEAIKGYWNDTLKPAFDAMMTWIRDTLLPTISNAWQNFQPIVGDVFTALKEFWTKTLKPIYQSMKKWIEEDLIPKFQGAWQSAQDKVDDVFRGISTLWNEVLKPIFNGIKTFLSKTLKPAFENVFSAISTTVDTTLGGIEKLWNESVKPIYNGILTFFKGVFKGDFETAWNGIQKIVEGVWNAIQIAAETVEKNAKTWGSTIIANFTLAIQNAWNLVKKSVLGLWDGFKDKAEELWTGAKQWASTIIANFTLSFKNAWNLVKKSVVGLWDAIKDKAKELWTGAKEWGKDIVNNFKNSISTTWTTAIKEIKRLFKQIPDAISDIVKSALNWGQDLIDNFKKGIENKWQGLKDKVEGVANSIKDFLGFSQPKKGPLSDFDTYAPDMMNLFIKGINDNITVLKATLFSLTQYIKQEFKSAGEKAYSSFKEGYDGYWGDQMKNAIKNPVESAYYAIRDMHWWDLADGIYRDVTHVCSWIHDAYKNAFDFSNIYVKTPHWEVTGWTEISGTNYPNMRVSWYRKAYDNPLMFTSPTVLGTPGGLKGFGDGPGGEIVLSAEKLREIVGTAGGTTNNTINVYQRDGENMDAFVRRIEEIMTRHDNQRKAAFA